jgi:phenylpropionate dioxygenase-like ring-hydroxylating dioxygenase large terminal subunit
VKNNNSANADILRFPHPILQSKRLKKSPQQVTLLDKKYVLYRNENGEPVALPDVCPHRGALLSKGKVNTQGELVCAYHAWRIKSDGNVTCPSVPKRSCKIPVLKTWERYGFIWIANADVPDESFPEFTVPGHELIGGFSSSFKAPLKVVLDNFGEVEHAFQVHSFIGPSRKTPAITNFSVDIQDDKTFGYFSCKYRPLPFFMRWFFGIKKNDLYHNDWVFKFNPLHGSYNNYWTDATRTKQRPISFIITSFLVPITDNEVKCQVFVQISIKNRLLKLIAPVLKFATLLITKFEIDADGDIAAFAPADAHDGSQWRLTFLDKQIMANRKRMETIYFASEKDCVV